MKRFIVSLACGLAAVACQNQAITVDRPAALDGDRFVLVRGVTGSFQIRQSPLRSLLMGRESRVEKARNEKLMAESAELGAYAGRNVERKLLLTGFSTVNESARVPGLVFTGTMRMELVRGLFYDSAELVFQGELIATGGGTVASGEVRDVFLPGSVRGFQELLQGPVDRPIRVWFDSIEQK